MKRHISVDTFGVIFDETTRLVVMI